MRHFLHHNSVLDRQAVDVVTFYPGRRFETDYSIYHLTPLHEANYFHFLDPADAQEYLNQIRIAKYKPIRPALAKGEPLVRETDGDA